jgi:mannose-6-phosphate isomerase-like protein (cupin superfamily)
VIKLSRAEAFEHEQSGLVAWYYQFPEVGNGMTLIYAEVTGDHGQRRIGDDARIYYVIDGEGDCTVDGESTTMRQGDVIVIPPFGEYSYFATKPGLKLLLVMGPIDLTKLPSKHPT